MLTGVGPDSIRFYLTGADSDGGVQADPDMSLGKYRSATEELPLGFELFDPIAGLVVEAASGVCGVGNGILTALGASSVAFTAPSGSQGAAVAIANGQTRIVPDDDTDKFLRVRRNSDSTLVGTATVRLVSVLNNAIGQDNVHYQESNAGHISYRCLCVKNIGAYPISDLRIWVKSGTTGIAIGKEAPSAQPAGYFTDKTGDGDELAPGGVSFYSPASRVDANVIVIGSMYPGSIYGLWVRRTIAADADPAVTILSELEYDFEAVDF